MTNQEIETIRNVIARLKCEPVLVYGQPRQREADEVRKALRETDAQIYLDTWVIPALECLLPESRDPALAVELSR